MRPLTTPWRLVAPAGLMAVLALLAGLLTAATRPAAAETPHPQRLFWSVPGDTVMLANGWTLTTTEGPMIEVADADEGVLGYVELLNFPLGDDLAAATNDGALLRALRERVRDFHAVIGEDREALEDGRYDYRAGSTVRQSFGDTSAIRYHATTFDTREDKVVERIRSWMAVSANQLWVLAVNGLDPDFLPSDLMMLTPDEVSTLIRHLDDVIVASPLPDLGTALEDGIVVGVEGGLAGGKVYLVQQGERARIAQPRPMTEQDVREAGLEKDRRIAHLDVTSASTGSWFAVVPADGLDARLHVVIGDTMHEVAVQAVETEVVDTLTDTRGQWLDKLALPGA